MPMCRPSQPRRVGASLGWALSDIVHMGRILDAFERHERNNRARLRIPASKLEEFLDRDQAPTTKEAYEIAYGDERDAPGGHTRGEFIMMLDQEAQWHAKRAAEHEEIHQPFPTRTFARAIAVIRMKRPQIADELLDRLRRGKLDVVAFSGKKKDVRGETSQGYPISERVSQISEKIVRPVAEPGPSATPVSLRREILSLAATLYHEHIHQRTVLPSGLGKARARVWGEQIKFVCEFAEDIPEDAVWIHSLVEDYIIESKGWDKAYTEEETEPWVKRFWKKYKQEHGWPPQACRIRKNPKPQDR